ncbi:1-phosphofructokinase [Methylobacillus flagellatus]|uniref:1-phosphofructokinase n=1 Tax=Methylobacillus flagellatus TaxID=405 RepID=UPI0010FA308B|nr:1-phosphofructokinase [Methylobacillus flagellatus]
MNTSINHSSQIVTLTLNPAIDQSLMVPGFRVGEVNRVAREQSDPGGKGVNVSCFLADLGYASAASGFIGIDNSQIFEQLFAEKAIADDFVRLPGKTRVNIKIIDAERHRITDVNFPGPIATSRDLQLLNHKLKSLLFDHDWFVLSGSLPEGVPGDYYADLIQCLKQAGKKVMLDTSGTALREGLAAKPDVIKPNINELEQLLGTTLQTPDMVLAAAHALIQDGIEEVVVSMGKQGAIFANRDGHVWAVPPAVAVKSTVGAGDAMVAGYIAARIQQLDLESRAKLATATAMGALTALGPRLPAADVIQTYTQQVSIKTVA